MGTPANRPTVHAWFEKCIKSSKMENFTWHCLRHTFASNLVMQSVDIRTAQELMGHKTIQMTLRYAHLAPQHQLAAVQRLCDTKTQTKEEAGAAQNGVTDTRTSTGNSEAAKGNTGVLQ
jgi:site-specific recombinase XerC